MVKRLRRDMAVRLKRMPDFSGDEGEKEVPSSTDGQIADIQEVDMADVKNRQSSMRETRGSQSGAKKDQKIKKTKPVAQLRSERPGLRRTSRKNAAQRYKLGKIAAAEENRMIGAELRSERRRSTEGVAKVKAPSGKKSKGASKSLNNSPVNGVTDDVSLETDVDKDELESQQVDNLRDISAVDKPDLPESIHQVPDSRGSSELKRPTAMSSLPAESDVQPLNLAASIDCGDQRETGDVAPPLPMEEDDGDSTSNDQAVALSVGNSAHDDAGLDPLGGEVSGDWGCTPATSEEVKTESVQSDSPSGERREMTTGTKGGTEPSKRPAGSPSDTSVLADPNWGIYKRRRPMEEGNTCLTCPVCSEEFQEKHHLTLHFREHNTTTMDGMMHSCKLCGKKLSSTSSLDRHMLIHSGERPHRCPICPMAFTTNGNMRRHIRTHEKGAAASTEGEYVTETAYSKPRKRIPSKRLLDSDELDKESTSPQKRLALEDGDSPLKSRVKEEELTCPICGKAFLCHYGLQTHMDLHPNVIIKCDMCEATFKNHRGLRMHTLMSHKKPSPTKTPPAPDVPLGFQDLGSVADISCDKFPLIAQVWCERNVRRCNSIVHQFICQVCSKAFPCSSALDLHKKKNHSAMDMTMTSQVEDVGLKNGKENVLVQKTKPTDKVSAFYSKLPHTFPSQVQFLATLNLKPSPSPIVKNAPNKNVASVQQATPTKSKFPFTDQGFASDDEVEADRDFADVGKILTLTTSASSNPLLMLKHLSRGVKQSPVKASALSSTSTSLASKPKSKVTFASKPPPAHSHLPDQYKTQIRQADHEPRSGDPATEMHFPMEVARDETKVEHSATSTQEKTSHDVGSESEPNEVEKTEEAAGDSKNGKKTGKYVCKHCQENFPQYSALKIHLRSHLGLTPFKCLLCDYSSADKSTLVRHMRTHSGERPYSCKMCDFPFTTKANCERHIKKRHGKETKIDIELNITHNTSGGPPGEASPNKFRAPDTLCKLCNREFRFFRDLQNHLKVHQRTPSKFFCLKCQTGLSSKNNCARHITKCHPEIEKDDLDNFMMVKQVETKDISQTMANSFASNGEQLSPIDFSRKSPIAASDSDLSDQSWLSAYTLPNMTDVDAPIDLSLPKEKNSSFLPPVDSSLGRLRFKRVYHKFYSKVIDALVCPHCSRAFKRGSVFKEHIRSHITERPNRCYYCKAAFTMKDSLDKHIERRHGDESKSESPAQSFIPKVATPMQFKLMSRSSHGLRVRIAHESAEATDMSVEHLLENQTLKSPGSSFGSDASGELASVSKILAASSNNFQVCFPPTGAQVKPKGEKDDVKETGDNENKNEFAVPENPTNKSEDQTEWDTPVPSDIELSEEYDLVIDESIASSSESTTGLETQKPKERVTERDRSNLPTKEMCPYCNRKFPWISSLRRHILTHTGLKPFQCPQCNSSFSTKSNCERHIVRRHCLNVSPGSKAPELPFTCLEGCSDCAYSTKLKLIKHYEVQHVGVPFPECYKNEVKKLPASVIRNALARRASKLGGTRPFGSSEFRSRVGMSGVTLKLTRHKPLLKRRHSSHDEKPLSLVKKTVTGEEGKSLDGFSRKKHLFSHKGKPFPIIFKKKKRKSLPTMVNINGSRIGASRVGDQVNSQPVMDLSVTSEDINLITESLGYVTGEGSGQPSRRKGKSKRKNARHSCSNCCKRFKSATTLKRHYRVHTLEHPFRCTECSASFTTKFNCQRHMLKLHGKSKEETLRLIAKQKSAMSSENDGEGNQELAESGVKENGFIVDPEVPGGVKDADVGGSSKGMSDESQDTDEDENEDNKEDLEEGEVRDGDGDSETDDFGEDGEIEVDETASDLEETNMEGSNFDSTWDEDSTEGPSDNPASDVKMPRGRGRDVFVSGTADNSDIIQNLLGIQDSSVIDQMLDSADSAAKLLGVE
ncbi:ras-responsive element-binding protein 1-like isoform X2 [Asterias amurensis]|uniref:ras-responsive element-binding protein 1-like isoform X2 n=1 Tax=Asterias amurensis TaxID=7602 RepID=UPI003AB8E456